MSDETSERWFTPAELAELSRPTTRRAIEAIEAGRYDDAVALCASAQGEWRYLHDLMAELILGLISFVHQRVGEEAVEEAWTYWAERSWRRPTEKILATDRRAIVEALAATWRAHSGGETGPNPGRFTITEDDEKFTFTMNPCGSGQRLWRNGAYRGEKAYPVTAEAHDWSYGRKNLPLYCTHCTFMNESLPIRWFGLPLYPSDPPEDFDHDPCTWYWYKNPDDIPERFAARYGGPRPDQVDGR
jgi:hypothetical protein